MDLAEWALLGDLAQAQADLDRVDAERRYRADAWTWVKECVWTVDELDPRTPIKAFPVAVCLACGRYAGHDAAAVGGRRRCAGCGDALAPLQYLEALARQWQAASPALLLVPKARRMRLTWLFVALHVWLAWTRPLARIFFVSSKEEKSAELIERARGILARLPKDLLGPIPLLAKNSPPEVTLQSTGAKILGVPEGSDQLRQYTATAILADEFGTWEWPRSAFAAMRPCIDGGGRLTLLSSAWPGFWRELVAGEALG
jgi:hypothetical protein